MMPKGGSEGGQAMRDGARAFLAGWVLAACVGAAAAAGSEADPSRALYLQYCGACHGPDGRGDGLAATFFRPKPPDLTQLAKRNRGEFPFNRTMEIIDGRNTLRAHGDPLMPVWGEVFQEQAGWSLTRRAEVRGKLMMITDHLRSIQEK
jgi:mono/diheme cytochrome c family protein